MSVTIPLWLLVALAIAGSVFAVFAIAIIYQLVRIHRDIRAPGW